MTSSHPGGRPPSEPAAEPWSNGEPPRPHRLQEPWLRVRLCLFMSVVVILVTLLLDFVLVQVLPLPPRVAALSRSDLLMVSSAAWLAVLGVVILELRPVSKAIRTLGLGLRLSTVERQRSLRTALSFPVVLPVTVMLMGTAGNLISFGFDLMGRTPWLWYAVHTTVVSQCFIVAACFPIFVYARGAMRPFVRAMGGEQLVTPGVLGMRGRIVVLVVTLAMLITVPSVSLLLMQLESQKSTQRDRTMRELSESLAREAQHMGSYSFSNYVRTTAMRDGTRAFLLDTAKVQAGRLKLRRSWTPPAALVSRAVKTFLAHPGEAGRRPVKVELQPGLPPIHVDPDRAAQALALLLRALRDDHGDANLYLRARTYRSGMDSGVELEVGDTGGKPLDPVGESYFSQMIPRGNGHSLRLAPHLAAQLIRRQRGRVTMLDDDQHSVGFRVSFPLGLTGEMPAVPGL